MKHNISFLFFLFYVFTTSLIAQENQTRYSFGVNYGQANQNNFLLNDPDYTYSNQYIKIQMNYLLSTSNKWRFELTLEPSYYKVEHQLLNKYFIRPDQENFEELRETYTQKRRFNEFALNLGLIARYRVFKTISTYFQASVGPMVSGADTERLRKGFAFSDILGLGFSWHRKKTIFDVRFTLRHNSNLDFALPNSGHNSAGIETGVSFYL